MQAKQNGIGDKKCASEGIEISGVVQAAGGRHKKPQGTRLIFIRARVSPRGMLQKRDRSGLINNRVDLQVPEPARIGGPRPEKQNECRGAKDQGDPKKIALAGCGFHAG